MVIPKPIDRINGRFSREPLTREEREDFIRRFKFEPYGGPEKHELARLMLAVCGTSEPACTMTELMTFIKGRPWEYGD